jgi:DNA-binding CsgD family transcriptional regulator
MKVNSVTVAETFVATVGTAGSANAQNLQFPAEEDLEIICNNLRFTEKVFPNSALMVCPVSHAGLHYISENSEHIFGFRPKDMSKDTLIDFFSMIHPDDLPAVKQCLDFMRGFVPYDPELFRFTTFYRVKNGKGEYLHIKEEKLALKTGENRFLYFMTFSDISETEKFIHVNMDIYKKTNGAFSKISSYNPKQQEKMITPRQNDIAQLIMKGFSNQEIADRLNVSIYTIKNHKRMLFRKVNVKNSMELANYVRQTK